MHASNDSGTCIPETGCTSLYCKLDVAPDKVAKVPGKLVGVFGVKGLALGDACGKYGGHCAEMSKNCATLKCIA
jgi:hypothetical protein